MITLCSNLVNYALEYTGIEMKENEGYGVAMAIQALQAGQPQMSMPDDTFMSRNVCYATAQHMEIVDNECYGCVSTKQQTVHVHT